MKGNAKIGVWIAVGLLFVCCGGGFFFAYRSIQGASAKIAGARMWVGTALEDMSKDWSESKAKKYFAEGGLPVSGGAKQLQEYKSKFGQFEKLGTTFEMMREEVEGQPRLSLGLRGRFEKDDAQIRVSLTETEKGYQITRLQITPETDK
ncbi:MAG: hypothetical protein ABL949_10890 [Fimbriimonadaceae bacterium]